MATVKTTPIILPGIVKNIELNGCWSEPLPINDDRHLFLFVNWRAIPFLRFLKFKFEGDLICNKIFLL